jgi:uncharacterized membrane protein HdeD (DUF308 family)
MKCHECGGPVSEQDLFCGQCGAILADPVSEEPADPPMYDQAPMGSAPAAPPEPMHDARAVPDTRARIALILGIVSIGSVVLTCLPFFGLIGCIGPVVGVAAIISGFIVKRDVRARGGLQQDWKRANLGMWLGIASLALYFVFLAFTIVLGIGMEFLRGY